MMTMIEQTPLNTDQTIVARDFLLPRDTTVDAALRVAEFVVQILRAGGTVVVDFEGMRGVSSSYFNALFRSVGDATGTAGMRSGMRLQYDSEGQQVVGERSWRAVIEFLDGPDTANGAAS